MHTDWAAEYRSSYPDLVRYLHFKVGDADRARDLAQEVFARALGHSPANPRGWLFTVASNLARDEARLVVRRKRHLALLRGEATVHSSPPPDPAAAFEASERRTAVREVLDALGERDREVLLLWNAGLSYQEIARQIGLAPGSVGTTLARARRRFVDAFNAREARHAAP